MLTSTPTITRLASCTISMPRPFLVCGLDPINCSGSEWVRGGITLTSGLQALGSFRSPTPRARGVHAPGATPLCHSHTRQGSFVDSLGSFVDFLGFRGFDRGFVRRKSARMCRYTLHKQR